MTIIAQAGIFGFGPQAAKGTVASTFSRHKAGDIDFSPVDDVRTGPPEIGGVPVPTIPYKAGSYAQGGATIYPRLEDTFGWLLYGSLGRKAAVVNGASFPELALRRKALTTGTQTITTGINAPGLAAGRLLVVKGWRNGSSALTGNVVINGTSQEAQNSETIALSDRAEVSSTNHWITITSIELPVRVNTDGGDMVSVGWTEDGVNQHTFQFDANDAAKVPWMSFREVIPGGDTSTPFGIQYTDCKMTEMTFTMPNEGLIAARAGVMGRTFEFLGDASSWTWGNTYESYESIPIGCTVGGYISVPSFEDRMLPVVNATVGIQNQPLDVRQERIFGSPDLEDITIVTRQLVFDVTAKWRDPALYRALSTGSRTGTLWSTKPFVHSLNVMAVSPDYISSTVLAPYAVQIESDSVMWQMNGPVRLSGNEIITLRLRGVALDTSGNYASFKLFNEVADYTWPT